MLNRELRDKLVDSKRAIQFFGEVTTEEVTGLSFEEIYLNVTPSQFINELNQQIQEGSINKEKLLNFYPEVVCTLNKELLVFLKFLDNIFTNSQYTSDVKKTVISIHKCLRVVTLNAVSFTRIMQFLDMDSEAIDAFKSSHNQFIRTMFNNYLYEISSEGYSTSYAHYTFTFRSPIIQNNKFLLEKTFKETIANKLKINKHSVQEEVKTKYGFIDILLGDSFAIELKKDSVTLSHCLQVKRYLVDNNYSPVIIGSSVSSTTKEAAIDFGITIYTYEAHEANDQNIDIELTLVCGTSVLELEGLKAINKSVEF